MIELDPRDEVQDLPNGRHPTLVHPEIRWINPHRFRKSRKVISPGCGTLSDFYVSVEFPLSGVRRTIGPVRLVDAGLRLWEDFGQSERLDKDALTYKPSDTGVKRVRLFVLVFMWAREIHVRRLIVSDAQIPAGAIVQHAAMKVALTISKDERSMFRRTSPWRMSGS